MPYITYKYFIHIDGYVVCSWGFVSLLFVCLFGGFSIYLYQLKVIKIYIIIL